MKRLFLTMAALAVVASGCSGGSTGSTSSDCGIAAQRGGTTYTEMGFTDASGTPAGEVELSECHDNGTAPEGAVLTGHGERVDAFAFEGYDPDDVLGIELGGTRLRILIADGVGPKDVDRILMDLIGHVRH